jgi:hypothetical protein
MASKKIDINHVQKFDGFYFHVWKHRLSLIFKQEKHLLVVEGIKANQLHKLQQMLPKYWPPMLVVFLIKKKKTYWLYP